MNIANLDLAPPVVAPPDNSPPDPGSLVDLIHAAPSIHSLSRFRVGEMVLDYRLDRVTGLVGLRLFPIALEEKLVARREWLLDFEHQRSELQSQKMRASVVDSLVQVKVIGDDYPPGFSQGLSLRNSATTLALKYSDQTVEKSNNETIVTTRLRNFKGCEARHRVSWKDLYGVIEITTEFYNGSSEPVSLELISSFSIGDITPFHSSDGPCRLRFHRFRSGWSAEGRLETRSIEELNLERSWQDHAVRCERFGQVGSMPVKGYFPFAAVEDVEAGVCWGAQLAWAGSWQMELYRQSDSLSLSGGLADREFGHWSKTLMPGESFFTPSANVACVAGDLDALCHRLTSVQAWEADTHPIEERDLPIVCNEFCTSWGNPTHEQLERLAKCLSGTAVRYLVIDAGWYADPASASWAYDQGCWNANRDRFPQGLAAISKAIRSHGLIPGLWFEMEVAGSGSASFYQTNHQLKRDGIPVTVANRHFWDFRDPWVQDYLAQKIIGTLREGDFGYVKIDYNETLGIGVDGAESIGEGLRQHLVAVTSFFNRMREELPHLVIESCSSGGHRLEPSMIARSAMSSFSDAHESLEVPIIAANLHRVMLPRQSQIWAVLRKQDEPQRLLYSLAATFLGRMCLSGDLTDLDEVRWSWVQRSMDFYLRMAPIIKEGTTRIFGTEMSSYRHPKGWQGVRRLSKSGSQALVVVHTFDCLETPIIRIPFPSGSDWRIQEILSLPRSSWRVDRGSLVGSTMRAFDSAVVHVIKENQRDAGPHLNPT